MTTDRRELQVIERDTGEVVHRVNITGRTEAQIQAEAAKLRQRINEEEFYIEDTETGRAE